MIFGNKLIYGASFCTMLFIITNALEYTLQRIRLPCNHRIHPLILQQLALKKYYENLIREKYNLGNPFNNIDQAPFNEPPKTDLQVLPTKSEDDSNKALKCAKLACSAEELGTAVCACNHVTGRVATFKDLCDLKRHNCRYDTVFKAILPEICPWEYQFRRNGGKPIIDYSDPKYYNA
nr:uncharacterized protein LOC128678454 [Plodia interpunctella]